MSKKKPDQAKKEKEFSPEDIQAFKLQALKAIQTKPSDYKIDVQDSSMLPDKLKSRKKLEFVIKPPTFYTLSKLAEIVETIPGDILMEKKATTEVLNHLDKIVEMICVMIHGSSRKPMPEWYHPFMMKNVTTQEALLLWQETAMKIDTSFFLPFIQTAKLMNPMSMSKPSEMKKMRDSIHLPSLEGL